MVEKSSTSSNLYEYNSWQVTKDLKKFQSNEFTDF